MKQNIQYIFLIFCWTHALFIEPLIALFQTSGDVSFGFQSQSGQSNSHLAETYVIYEQYFYVQTF